MVCQVGSLMWLRTIMNYQYRHGGTITNTTSLLYKEGGIPRFYKGVGVAILQGPLSRFGDTFSNTLVLSLCNENPYLINAPVFVKTAFASVTAGLFRILLMPIDTIKTSMQVDGSISKITHKLKTNGPRVLYNGSLATSSATMIGHYPWFMTFNMMNEYLPNYDKTERMKNMSRNALIGFTSSVVSDTTSNSFRIVKTAKQSHTNATITYKQIVEEVLAKDGLSGLFGRGLKIRLFTNGLQGILFSVIWKYLENR
jgi:hypothetical protein